jgi:hypothetical protein
MIDLTDCPDCGAPAEVRWMAVFPGTEGRAGVLCARQHWMVVPAAMLPGVRAIAIPTQRSAAPELPALSWLPSRRKPRS